MCGISLREIAAIDFKNQRRRREPYVAADGNRRELDLSYKINPIGMAHY